MIIAFAVVVFGTVLGGCRQSVQRSDSIRFVSLAWQEQAIAANKRIVAEWNADTTRTPVEYVQGTWGSVHDFLITSFETGDVPDIFHYESIQIVDFARRGYLTDLAPLIADSSKSDIIDVAWSTVQADDGAIYGVPFLLESLVVLYNKKLFRDAGIEPPTIDEPWTWPDLRAAAKKLTTKPEDTRGRTVYGAAFGLRSSANIIMNLSLGFGGGFFHRDGVAPYVEVGDAEKELLSTIHEMIYVDESASTAAVGTSGAGMIPGFIAGDTAILVGIGSWARQQLVENAPPDFEWGVLPPIKAITQQQGANAQTLSIPSASDKQVEAMAFIEYFLETQNMTQLAKSDWMLPTRRSSMEALRNEPPSHGWETTLAVVDDLVEGPWLDVPGLTEWKSRIANPTFQDIFSNRLTIDAAAERIESDSRRILKRYQ